MQGKKHILTFLLSTLLIANVIASDDSYYDRFLEASKTEKGFISQPTLLQTNNAGPNITNASISFSKFAENGELAGIKIGMNMSQVVEAWGKPHSVFTFCGLGPRFWYHPTKYYGDITLAFKENKLAIIALNIAQIQGAAFDNGLNAMTSDFACEKILGSPALRDPRTRGWFFGGEIAYCTNGFRTDLNFRSVAVPKSAHNIGVLSVVSVASKDAEVPVRTTTVTNLLNYPESFEGLRVKVSGYLKSGRELAALYHNHEDATQSRDDKVWIAPTAKPGHEEDVQSIKEGNVRIIGVVDCDLQSLEFGAGRSSHWNVKISELELLEHIKD
jgi:hypothetical protein